MVELTRQAARNQATERASAISSDHAAQGLAKSSALADAQYRNYLTAVEAVAQEYCRAEEAEPLDAARISTESWLSEAACNSRELLDTEFGWLRSQVAALFAGSLSALETLRERFERQAEVDRERMLGTLDTRLRLLANRRTGTQNATHVGSTSSPEPLWPAAISPPKTAERADGLPMLFKKDALATDLRATAAFATERQLPFAVLMLDLDHFKRVNDDYGHQKGDEVLVGIANVLCLAVFGKGRAYRYGGEEMCALLPNATRQEAVALADRIRNAIAAARIEGIGAPTTVSIGLAVYPDDSNDPQELLRCADVALYKAKAMGRDRVVAFEPGRG
jgi:diguanylate cyclase (GGDEF)-like protein